MATPITHSPPDDTSADARITLPVIEESIRVEKVDVDRGGYRITKQVETRQEVVDEILNDQRVEIERRPIDRQLDSDEMPNPRYEGETLIIPVVEEMLITVKRLRLVEEVRITTVQGTHRNPQEVTLRKDHVLVERLAPEQTQLQKPSSSPPKP